MTAVRCVDLCKTYRQGDEDIKALDGWQHPYDLMPGHPLE